MTLKLLITGGSGFIGKALIKHLTSQGHAVTVLTRHPGQFTPPVKTITQLHTLSPDANFDVIINLAGAPINKRWSPAYKKTLINSRVNTTQSLLFFIKSLHIRPKLLISVSAIGYYTPLSAFTHQLCQSWEARAKQAEQYGVRVCVARLGVVLGKKGGALQQMLPAFKLGLGGKISHGQQMLSWIHINDVINAFYFFIKNKTTSGIYNLTSPYPISNAEFTHYLGQQLRRPTRLPFPAWMIKMLWGEMGQALLLESYKITPQRLLDAGFSFQYSTIDQALNHLLASSTAKV